MTSHSASFVFALLISTATHVFAQPAQTPKFSSREQLRACLDEEDRLKPQLPILKAKFKAHEQEMLRLQDEIKAHVAEQSAVDITDETAVNSFNTKIQSLNQRVVTLNDRSEELNKEHQMYSAQIAETNKRCAGMAVMIKDRDAVLRERLALGKK